MCGIRKRRESDQERIATKEVRLRLWLSANPLTIIVRSFIRKKKKSTNIPLIMSSTIYISQK
jgi:hypothetical protein